jgi:hypothetical protein
MPDTGFLTCVQDPPVYWCEFETTVIRVIKEVPDPSLTVFTNGTRDSVFIGAGVPRVTGTVP